MKKFIYILILFVAAACGNDDNGDSDLMESDFSIVLTQDISVAEIDEVITISILANENIRRLDVSKDNWQTSSNLTSASFGSQTDIYVDYESVGAQTISVRATNDEGITTETSVNVSIERGSAIQLSELKLNSFFNINETWDPEFNDSNVNRLADVFFVLIKPMLNPFDGSRTTNAPIWYESSIKMNQGDLLWNIQNENLIVNPNLSLFISFVDFDGVGFGNDLMQGPPFEREVEMSRFIGSPSNTVQFDIPEISLNFDLSIE